MYLFDYRQSIEQNVFKINRPSVAVLVRVYTDTLLVEIGLLFFNYFKR